MNRLFSQKALTKIFSVFCIVVLTLYYVPRINPAHAVGITVSNVTFDPTTGYLFFNYTGASEAGVALHYIHAGSGNVLWQGDSSTVCSSNVCQGYLSPNTSAGDSGVTTAYIELTNGDISQTLTYPLSEPTTYTPMNWSAGVRAYQVNATDGQTTTSGTYSNMSSGTQSITLATKSIVYVTAHANAHASGSGLYSYIRTVYNDGSDHEIGTQGYTNATSDGQSITAGGVVTLAAGTYTIAMQDKVYVNPTGTATYYQPSMAIMIIPSP